MLPFCEAGRKEPCRRRDSLPENEVAMGVGTGRRERTNTEPLDTAMPEVSCLIIFCGTSQLMSGLGQCEYFISGDQAF